eukprot:789780_1
MACYPESRLSKRKRNKTHHFNIGHDRNELALKEALRESRSATSIRSKEIQEAKARDGEPVARTSTSRKKRKREQTKREEVSQSSKGSLFTSPQPRTPGVRRPKPSSSAMTTPAAGRQKVHSSSVVTPAASTPVTPAASTPVTSVSTPVTPVVSRPNRIRSSAAQLGYLLKVKQELSSSELPENMEGREEEEKIIWSFFENQLRARQSNSLYICGSPGTGKSALVRTIQNRISAWEKKESLPVSRIVYINAMQVTTANAIYPKILQELSPNQPELNPNKAAEKLQKMFLGRTTAKNKRKKMTIVIVDEIDGLLSSKPVVLYQLFQYPKLDNSTLLLVGIANSLNLTEKFLPRLAGRGDSPEVLIFESYSAAQLTNIITRRIRDGYPNKEILSEDEDLVPFFDKDAVKIIAKKVASMSGDVRKSLEICRRCLSVLIDQHTISPVMGMSPAARPEETQITLRTAKRILSLCFGSKNVELIQELPRSQLIVLCTLVILCRNVKDRVSVTKAEKFIRHLSRTENLPNVIGFTEILSTLAGHNLISFEKSSKNKYHQQKFSLTVLEEDVRIAAAGKAQFVRRLLSKKNCCSGTYSSAIMNDDVL